MTNPRLAVISIITDDMPAAIAFYESCGLQLSGGGPNEPHSEFGGAGIKVMLDTREVVTGIDPHWKPPSGGHAMALAFDCGTPDDVDATFDRMVAAGAGVGKKPWDAFWGQRYAVIIDPDGNPVDLFAALG
ncbi:VOC family protein [Actinoallomurus sp. NPDC050550]|uniref:VOC family protein n=1 Tax=Actinoallomurus sp. NPDC050550 TaxID=3154937 RepID=UPI0033D6AEE6